MDRYSLNFDRIVWANLRKSIRNKGTSSIWYKTLSVIFRFFSDEFIPLLNHIYRQGFPGDMDGDSLELEANDYRIFKRIGESREDFLARYYSERLLQESNISADTTRQIFMILLGVEADIVETNDFESEGFTIGVSLLGEGKCFSGNYLRFTFDVYLPDLSGLSFDKKKVINLIDEFSPNNEYFIYERRGDILFKWEVA